MLDETVVYTPPDCMRWFEIGAGGLKRDARKKAQIAKAELEEKDLGGALKAGLSAALRAGKAAVAELASKRVGATEVRLYEDRFELVSLLKVVEVRYKDVVGIEPSSGGRYRYVVTTKTGRHVLSPVAYLVSGSARIPVGWCRNGIEVPYLVLIEELAARCGVELGE